MDIENFLRDVRGEAEIFPVRIVSCFSGSEKIFVVWCLDGMLDKMQLGIVKRHYFACLKSKNGIIRLA